MSVGLLATAAVQLSKVSQQEEELEEALQKWVAKTLKPSIPLPKLRALAGAAGVEAIGVLLASLTKANLRKLAKGLDRHNTELDAKDDIAILGHLVALASGNEDPGPEPPKAPIKRQSKPKAAPLEPSAIRAIGSRDERRSLLRSVTAPKLRSYIKAEALHPAGIPPKATKDDLIYHILKEWDAADGSVPRLLADSKYRVPVPQG